MESVYAKEYDDDGGFGVSVGSYFPQTSGQGKMIFYIGFGSLFSS